MFGLFGSTTGVALCDVYHSFPRSRPPVAPPLAFPLGHWGMDLLTR